MLLAGGAVRCWGNNLNGGLGYQRVDEAIGDDETPASAGDLPVGGVVTQLATAVYHNCVLLDGGAVRCWGTPSNGRLGYGNANRVGDDETPASAGDVDLGAPASQIAVGFADSCAVLAGKAHCWGDNIFGGLGQGNYGDGTDIGDDEPASGGPDLPFVGTVTQIAMGAGRHICVLLDDASVHCWGTNTYGQLGYGNGYTIGDDETAVSVGAVNVGGPVRQLAVGAEHTCALLVSGSVRCWGSNEAGQLGYPNIVGVSSPATAGDVDVGGKVTQVAAGGFHTCAVLESGAVRCWGHGEFGQLGYANEDYIGDDESPASAGDVDVGPGKVRQLALGDYYSCALFEGGALRCWGSNYQGRLGYGHDQRIGDDETPASAGEVPY